MEILYFAVTSLPFASLAVTLTILFATVPALVMLPEYSTSRVSPLSSSPEITS